ncbi:hypothetical protein [Elioraea sp.]|uniref:hypothetical protein n=1 Tax=Elioraea sp. TaxID=2185103 RepID=UPI0025BB935A|nr:hypothetical protein [Elioraea sp.]
MAEQGRATAAASIAAASFALAWVAFYNGYPLVFADTGTYLGQALQRYLGWDRPVFYSFLLLALHWGITLWAVPVVQAAVIAHLVWLVLRTLGAGGLLRYAVVIAVLCVGTAAPWFAAWMIPDIFTGAVVLVLWLLGAVPERLSMVERLWLVALGTVAIVVHQSHVPLAAGLVIVLLVGRWVFGLGPRLGARGTALLLAPLIAAMLGMMLANLAGHGRFSLSPFGANFLLARVIYDGPGAATLVEACPEKAWRLCAYLADLPPASMRYPSSDHFLWQPDSPFYRLGHPRQTAPEAGEIVAETFRRHGLWQLTRMTENTLAQLRQFRTGVGTDFGPWLSTPGPEPVIAEFLTGDLAAFRSARQATGDLHLLAPMREVHRIVVLLSLPAVLVAAGLSWWRGERAGTLLVAAILAAILGNAILAGGLSAVHDRYTARLAWLLPAATLALLLARPHGQTADQSSRA